MNVSASHFQKQSPSKRALYIQMKLAVCNLWLINY